MDKNTFLTRLSEELTRLGVEPERIARHIGQFEKYFSTMSDEEAAEHIEQFEDVTTVAENIFALTRRSTTAAADNGSSAGAAQGQMVAVEEKQLEPAGHAEVNGAEDYNDLTDIAGDERIDLDMLDEFDNEDERPRGSGVFWAIALLTLPITIPLLLVGMSVFFGVYAALALLVGGLVVATIAGAAGGAALSLYGIIYGIVQSFTSKPIGMYEIGLGVAICGLTLFVCILLYNIAIRLLPFLIRKWTDLLFFTAGRLKELIHKLKRECAKK